MTTTGLWRCAGVMVLVGCNPTPSPTETAPTTTHDVSPPPPPETSPFQWRARTGPDGRGPAKALKDATGVLPAAVAGVSCEYVIEPAEPCKGATCQFGKLWCTEGRHLVQTRALCHITAERPTDSGTANLRVIAGGTTQQIELSCADVGSDYWDRPRVTVPASARPLAPTATPPATATPSAAPPPASSVTPQAPTFRWKLEVTDPEGTVVSTTALSTPQGPVPHLPDGWRCHYDLRPGSSPNHRAVEFGILSCRRGEGVTFESTLVCATKSPSATGSSRKRDGYRNLGSLDLSNDGTTSDATVMLECRSTNAG